MTLLSLALLSACAAKDEGAPPLPATGDLSTDTAQSCEGAAPEIVSFIVEDGGLHDFSDVLDCAEDEDCVYPAVDLVVQGVDEDADLHQYILQFWYDATLDGAVSQSAAPIESRGSSGDPCTVGEQTWHSLLSVGTGVLDTDTPYEFAAVLSDAAGLESAPAIASGTTPGADGGRR